MSEKFQKDLECVAADINNKKKNIILIYGFNGSGKTQLSIPELFTVAGVK